MADLYFLSRYPPVNIIYNIVQNINYNKKKNHTLCILPMDNKCG